jgi:hypothetical protein
VKTPILPKFLPTLAKMEVHPGPSPLVCSAGKLWAHDMKHGLAGALC